MAYLVLFAEKQPQRPPYFTAGLVFLGRDSGFCPPKHNEWHYTDAFHFGLIYTTSDQSSSGSSKWFLKRKTMGLDMC